MTRGLLIGKNYEAGPDYRGVWGLYGSFDYIAPQAYRVSSTALSLGTTRLSGSSLTTRSLRRGLTKVATVDRNMAYMCFLPYAGRGWAVFDFAGLVGRFLISVPACRSASRTSKSACKFIQNCGLVPNQ
jgi:hypothetical protein